MKNFKFAAFLLAASASSFLITGCGKDDDDAQPNKTELLTKSEWKDVDLLIAGSSLIGDTSANYTPGMFKFKFEKSGTYTFRDDSSSENGTWKLIENDTKIILTDSDNDSDTATVSTLTSNNLNLIYLGGFIEHRFTH